MNLTEDPLARIDADELEADIDKAIDELFVRKSEAREPALAVETTVEEPVAEPPEEPAPVPSAEPEVDYLVQLNENLLTLDWEISEENIRSFENELQLVCDKVGEHRHSLAVIKMALGVLQYLRIAKGSAAPISIQFLHAATDGLGLFGRKPAPTAAECDQVMDKLLSQFRRMKAEIQRLRLATAPVADPVVEPPPHEEYVLEEIPEEEPELFAELLEEEPILEELPEEEPAPEEIAADEPITAESPGEEPILQELFGEQTILEEPVEQEPAPEEIAADEPTTAESPGEEPILQEDIEEERNSEASLEPPGTDFAPAAVPDEVSTSQQQLTQEAREQISQLSHALEDLGQETSDFFGRIMRAMANKPTLKKVERHFSSVYNAIEDKLVEAREISGNVGEVLTELELSLGKQQMGALSPAAQAEIDSQINIIQDAVESVARAAAHLRQNLPGKAVESIPSAEAEPLEDMGVETVEFSMVTEEAGEVPGSEPLLESVDEIPAEMVGQEPGFAATIYLADVANHTLGIPTEAVANVFKVSKRKAKAFRQRGYVRLADFRAAFRSIKRGITGPLADLKVKDLKKTQFPIITLSPETLDSDDTQAEAPAKGIVLLSNGERHGALFTDVIMQRTSYEAEDCRKAGLPGEVSGTAIIDGDFEVNVIDPDYVLS